MRNHLNRLFSLMILGIVVPFVTLFIVMSVPPALERIFPAYNLFGQTYTVRNGQYIVAMAPVEKMLECRPTIAPYAVFRYVENGVPRVASFELRNLDREPLEPREILTAGERRVVGPVLIIASQAAADLSKEFEIVIPCRRPWLGVTDSVIQGFRVPTSTDKSANQLLQDLNAQIVENPPKTGG